jgi:hypothetical protein
MVDKYEVKESPNKINQCYRKGQHIFYKGEDAQVLEVKPVFIIRIKGTSHVICGNIFNDVRPSDN